MLDGMAEARLVVRLFMSLTHTVQCKALTSSLDNQIQVAYANVDCEKMPV